MTEEKQRLRVFCSLCNTQAPPATKQPVPINQSLNPRTCASRKPASSVTTWPLRRSFEHTLSLPSTPSHTHKTRTTSCLRPARPQWCRLQKSTTWRGRSWLQDGHHLHHETRKVELKINNHQIATIPSSITASHDRTPSSTPHRRTRSRVQLLQRDVALLGNASHGVTDTMGVAQPVQR